MLLLLDSEGDWDSCWGWLIKSYWLKLIWLIIKMYWSDINKSLKTK